jgi:CelD/BcsL family acetyltransferase involved in cellulose biosynthesis
MSSPEVFELNDLTRLAGLRRDWLELADRLEGTSYFQTPDWVLAWWETLAQRPPTRVAAWRAPSGTLEGVVALSRDRERLHRRLPVAVPVFVNAGSGVGAADHCGWMVPAERAAEVDAWITETIGGSALLVRGADADWSARPLPFGARVVDVSACPRVELPLADRGAGPSPSFVRQLRRFTRRLEREDVRFEWVAPGHVDERLLATLFELHAHSRARRGGSDFGIEHLAFHRRLVEQSGPGRGPAAVVARHGEAIAGVLYGFWWKDTFAGYQSGWDPRFARHSIGSVLVLHALERAADEGARTFDFLRGSEPYKYRFGARDRWDRTWLVPRGTAGALVAARHRVRDRLHGDPTDAARPAPVTQASAAPGPSPTRPPRASRSARGA